MLFVSLLVHQLRASTLIDIIQQLQPETECYCKCRCDPITTTGEPATTFTNPSSICEPNVTAYYPHPDDICKRYVYCSRGVLRFNYQCQAGLYFTPGNNVCTKEVPPGCEYPDARVALHERTHHNDESKSIDIKWGECYNLKDIDMEDRISSINFLKNDCIYLCDTNNCDGSCSVIKPDDIRNCMVNLANCDFDKRAKSIRSCFYHGNL